MRIISDWDEKSDALLFSLWNIAKRWQYFIHFLFTLQSAFMTSLGYYYNQFFAYKKVNYSLAVQGYSFYLLGSIYL